LFHIFIYIQYVFCSDPTQIRPATSLGTTIMISTYCPLWSMEFCHGFVFKRRLGGWNI